jgi:predicted amidohydrolase
MSRLVTVAAAQINPKIFDKKHNMDKMEDYAEMAARQGAQLLVFPEAALTGYCFSSLEEARPLAEPVPGPSSIELAFLCRVLGLNIVFGMLEELDGQIYNAAVMVNPMGVVGTYRKTHLPYLGVDRFVAYGNGPLCVHKTIAGKVGMHICYDATFPEVARSLALQGADILALPTNWPEGRERMPGYVIHARALENHVYFIASDRVGEERGFRFIGRSKIISYTGDTLAEASPDREELIVATIDLDKARNKRVVYRPREFENELFGDRRPELYETLVRDAEVDGLRNNRGYVKRAASPMLSFK